MSQLIVWTTPTHKGLHRHMPKCIPLSLRVGAPSSVQCSRREKGARTMQRAILRPWLGRKSANATMKRCETTHAGVRALSTGRQTQRAAGNRCHAEFGPMPKRRCQNASRRECTAEQGVPTRRKSELWRKQRRVASCANGGQPNDGGQGGGGGFGCPRRGSGTAKYMQSSHCRTGRWRTMHCARSAAPRKEARDERGCWRSVGKRQPKPPGRACPICMRGGGAPVARAWRCLRVPRN